MHPHLKLLARNKGRGQFKAEVANDEATLYLYDAIVDSEDEAEWFGGVAPQAFINELKTIGAPTIHLRINSPGGSVFAARTMEQALREHKAKVVVHIDGLAASAATFIAMAGDEIVMNKGAMFMIHKAWTWSAGNADELRSRADLLDKIDGTLVQTYADRSGQDADKIAAWMAAETWFSAQEAVDNGFADAIAETPAKASADRWDLSAYANAPQPAASAMTATTPKNMMECKFMVGDRVEIVAPHGEAHVAGEIVTCSSEPVYGVLVDGEDTVHKWYVESELSQEGASAMDDGDGDMDTAAQRKKKHDPSMPDHGHNESDTSALMRRLEVVSRI